MHFSFEKERRFVDGSKVTYHSLRKHHLPRQNVDRFDELTQQAKNQSQGRDKEKESRAQGRKEDGREEGEVRAHNRFTPIGLPAFVSSALPADQRISMHPPCTLPVRKKDASKLESSSGTRLQLYAMALVRLGALSPTTSPSRSGSTAYLPPT